MMKRQSLAYNPLAPGLASQDVREPKRPSGVRRPENESFDPFEYFLAVRRCIGRYP